LSHSNTIKVNNLAILEILLGSPPNSTNKIYSGHKYFFSVAPPMYSLGDILIATSIPVYDNMMLNKHIANTDNNSSDSLEPLKDHEFLDYFTEYSPLLYLYNSYGTYHLPVNGTEIKVYTTSPHWLKLTNISKTPSLLFMLFILLALFSSKKSKNQESMNCLGKAKSSTF
jgi:hypothetical protein